MTDKTVESHSKIIRFTDLPNVPETSPEEISSFHNLFNRENADLEVKYEFFSKINIPSSKQNLPTEQEQSITKTTMPALVHGGPKKIKFPTRIEVQKTIPKTKLWVQTDSGWKLANSVPPPASTSAKTIASDSASAKTSAKTSASTSAKTIASDSASTIAVATLRKYLPTADGSTASNNTQTPNANDLTRTDNIPLSTKQKQTMLFGSPTSKAVDFSDSYDKNTASVASNTLRDSAEQFAYPRHTNSSVAKSPQSHSEVTFNNPYKPKKDFFKPFHKTETADGLQNIVREFPNKDNFLAVPKNEKETTVEETVFIPSSRIKVSFEKSNHDDDDGKTTPDDIQPVIFSYQEINPANIDRITDIFSKEAGKYDGIFIAVPTLRNPPSVLETNPRRIIPPLESASENPERISFRNLNFAGANAKTTASVNSNTNLKNSDLRQYSGVSQDPIASIGQDRLKKLNDHMDCRASFSLKETDRSQSSVREFPNKDNFLAVPKNEKETTVEETITPP